MTQYILIIVNDYVEAGRDGDDTRQSRARAQLRSIYTTLRLTDRLELWRDALLTVEDSELFDNISREYTLIMLRGI